MTHARWTDDFSSQKEQFIYISIIIIALSFHVKGSLIIAALRVCKTITQQQNQKKNWTTPYTPVPYNCRKLTLHEINLN